MTSKENLFYIFLFSVIAVILIFVYADKIWDKFDNKVVPLVSNAEDEFVATAGAGSADAQWITKIHINWDKGDVNINYANQQRITWKETYTKGGPAQYNTMQYWMNTHTLFIEYRTQDWLDKDRQPNMNISKNLQVTVPQGVVLQEVMVRCAEGEVNCNVEVKTKTIRQ